MTREEVIKGYMINDKHVIAEMLYDTIAKYERHIKELQKPKTCFGCRWQNCASHIISEHCDICSNRYGLMYEPKQPTKDK